MAARGREIRVDLVDVNSLFTASAFPFAELLADAAEEAGATVVGKLFADLGDNGSPPGWTVAILLDESHLTAHYYAEGGLLAINAFTCGKKADPQKAIDYILGCLRGKVTFQDSTARFREDDEPDGRVSEGA